MKINLGDGDYVHFYEPSDDCLEIKAKKINFVTSDATTARLTLNSEPVFPCKVLTQAEYDALATKSSAVLYCIPEEE